MLILICVIGAPSLPPSWHWNDFHFSVIRRERWSFDEWNNCPNGGLSWGFYLGQKNDFFALAWFSFSCVHHVFLMFNDMIFLCPRSWLIDSRGLASKVKNASLPATKQIKDCGANRECPNCHHLIDNSDVSWILVDRFTFTLMYWC